MGKKKVLSEKNLRQMLYPSARARSPWEFQSDERGEIFHRYTQNQIDDLRRKGILLIELHP